MKDVIFKQGMLKKQLSEAQDRIKNMLIAFVGRLATLTEETDVFHTRIDICAKKINQGGELSQIEP